MGAGVVTAAAGQSQAGPVGGTVADPVETRRVNERFQQMNRMGIECLPVLRDPSRHPPQQMAGQPRHAQPRHNQESGIVGDEVQMPSAHLGRPADEPVPRRQVTRRRRPGHRRDGIAPGEHHILQMFANGLGVTQVVVRVHQLTKESLFGRAAHLADLQRAQLAQAALPRLFPQRQGGRGGWTLQHVVGRGHPFGRQLDPTGPVQLQRQTTAHHVAQRAVGLDPVPRSAQLGRKPTAAPPGVLGDQTLDERGVFRANFAATIAQ